MAKVQTAEDLIEQHIDLVGGLGALGFGIVELTWLPQLAEYISPMIVMPFALVALTRWYRKLRERSSTTS